MGCKLIILLLMHIILFGEGNRLTDFAVLKSGGVPGQGFCWLYTGVLRHPTSGKELASIEGIELTEAIGAEKNCRSYLSRKAFAYVNSKNKSSLVERPQLRWTRSTGAVKRMEQIVIVGINEKGGYYSQITRPGVSPLQSSRIDVRTPLRPGGIQVGSALDIFHLIHSGSSSAYKSRWPLRKWVSFAPSPSARKASSEIGCSSEEYSVIKTAARFDKVRNIIRHTLGLKASPDVVVSFRRYGEAPKWVAGQSPCITELSAYRYRSMRDIPTEQKLFFEKYTPDLFLSFRNKKIHNESNGIISSAGEHVGNQGEHSVRRKLQFFNLPFLRSSLKERT